MYQLLKSLDVSLFCWLNSFQCSFADELMWIVSMKWVWIPLYIFVLYHLFINYKTHFIRLLVLIIMVVGLSDWISSGIIKNSVKRYRPSHNTELEKCVHLHKYSDGSVYRGGTYGFVSSHAANSFAIATLAFFFLRKKSALWRWLFPWALLVSVSRIYLGVHYPLDIIGGALVGITVALLFCVASAKFNWIKMSSASL